MGEREMGGEERGERERDKIMKYTKDKIRD